MEQTNHSWLQKNIRPLLTLVCMAAFAFNVVGLTQWVRGTPMTETELQIVWSVFGLYIGSRGVEKSVAIRGTGTQRAPPAGP